MFLERLKVYAPFNSSPFWNGRLTEICTPWYRLLVRDAQSLIAVVPATAKY